MNRKIPIKAVKNASRRTLSAAAKVLIAMFEFFDDMDFMCSHQNLCQSMSVSEARDYVAEIQDYKKKNRRAFNRLKNKGWIEDKEMGRNVIETLTENGEIAALEKLLGYKAPPLPKGEYCMVVFDIPEAAHATRDRFRNLLKRIGFCYHQRSVWCADKEVGAGLRRIVEILKIKRWVRVYKSHEC